MSTRQLICFVLGFSLVLTGFALPLFVEKLSKGALPTLFLIGLLIYSGFVWPDQQAPSSFFPTWMLKLISIGFVAFAWVVFAFLLRTD
jgi:Ni/Fe-hydrogenase subunit HybB-like protein